MNVNQTDRVIVLDIDGNRVAVFPGYSWIDEKLTLADMKRAYGAFKVMIENRRGERKGVEYC